LRATRWQGIAAAKGFAPQARATARTDFGKLIRLAMSVSLTATLTGIFRAAVRSGGAATPRLVRRKAMGKAWPVGALGRARPIRAQNAVYSSLPCNHL
jgi:hypothetical protein